MKKRQLLSLALMLLICQATLAQGSFSFSCAKDTTINGCANSCITLKAKIPDIRSSTSNYVINPLTGPGGCFRTYAPFGPPTGTSANLTIDDRYSQAIPITFPFPFYDDAASPYNSLVISTNGYISFDVAEAGQFSHYTLTPGNVPNTSYDKSLIMGVYHDLDPSVTTSPNRLIKYEVVGTAPHRRFIMSVYKVPQFSTACNNLIENTHQIVLYEGIGVIEVFVQSAQICPGWNSGRKMIGLQNANQNKGIMAPGRTATGPNWGTVNMNESWRFVPAVGPTLYRGVELYDLNGNLVAVGDTVNVGNNTFEVSFPNVCPSGNTTYIVKSKYAQFNNPNLFVYGTDTVNVLSNNPLSATATTVAASCANSGIGSATINPSGAPGPFEYSTDGGVTWQISNVVNLPAGTYPIRYRQIGTTCEATINIVIPEDPNAVSGDYSISNVLCNGGSTGSINVTGQNGTGIFEYSINGGTTYQSSGIFNNLPAGTYTIRVRDNSGCFRDTVVTILQPAALSATIQTTNATCSATPNGGINIEANGGTVNYQYSINGTTYQSGAAFAVNEGNYTVYVQDANGCTTQQNVTVNLTNDLAVQTRQDTTICRGASVALTTSGNAASYTWAGNNLSNTSIASPVAQPNTVGLNTYTLTATLGQCTVNRTVNITVENQVSASAGPDQTILSGDLVQLNGVVTGGGTFTWSSTPNDISLSSTSVLNPTAQPTATTTYTLTTVSVVGCISTDDVLVTVIPYCIRMKNAFSPNGDGINDIWKIYDQFDCLTKIKVVVFNRYGSKVYENNDYRNNFDGRYKGNPLPDGTYYAVVDFYLISGRKFTTKTDLTIIR